MKYSRTPHVLLIGVFSLLAISSFFYSISSFASVLNTTNSDSNNSQRLDLLTPQYSVEIPKAIGGPSDIQVNNKLALLSPQVGITTGTIAIKNIEVDPDGIVIYVVQDGDTLSEIAESFDVSMNTIIWENNINKGNIKPGQELRILPVTGVRHTIQKGDTFGGIAKKYDVETKDITIFNDLDATKLVPGKKIIIPNGIKQKITPQRKSSSSSASSRKTLAKLSTAKGEYITPTAGRITSRLGPRYGRYHYGIDYGAPTGTPIVATRSGTVTKTSCGSGYGKCLVIQHDNGTYSLYAHASKLYVSRGTKVVQGQKIAAVGSTGRSTGPHLHFEIRNSASGKALNPLSLIK